MQPLGDVMKCLFLMLCLFAFTLSVPERAEAQSRADRYTILVFEDGDMCRYQIQDHSDQDVFNIAPGGMLTIMAKGGLWVDSSVQDDPRGTPGTRSQRTVAVREEDGSQSFTARSEIGRSTEHKVQIQCCPSRRGRNECPKWIDAEPPRTSTGAVGMDAPGPEQRGPSAGEPVPSEQPIGSEQPAGGPVMRVDEN